MSGAVFFSFLLFSDFSLKTFHNSPLFLRTWLIVTVLLISGIYFSAHWCPPCRNFTPKLATFYENCKKMENILEIIFVSSDRDEEGFEEYFGEMPWLALPYDSKTKKVGTKNGVITWWVCFKVYFILSCTKWACFKVYFNLSCTKWACFKVYFNLSCTKLSFYTCCSRITGWIQKTCSQ